MFRYMHSVQINVIMVLSSTCYKLLTVRRKIFATEKFRESLPKRGAEIFATKIFAKAALILCVIV